MDKSIPLHLQEIIFSAKDPEISRKISKLEKNGELRKIAPRIYTPNFEDTAELLIKNNIFRIIGHLYPGVVLSHRSAFEYLPTSAGYIFLTYTYTKNIRLPGITLNFLKGKGPVDGDRPFGQGLFVSQTERALLENLQQVRNTGPTAKILTLPQIEERLEAVIRADGEMGLNKLRDRARELSVELNMPKEFVKLNSLISALLSTRPSSILTSPVARARAFGEPFDKKRVALFEKLFLELQKRTFPNTPEKNNGVKAYRNFGFFEAYFSNYIEGTEFEVAEARQIIETDKPMESRNDDSHDILGTYKIVSNHTEMQRIPKSAEELIEILKYRHKILLSARELKKPGVFKERNNQAGNTSFVDHALVRGTLIQAFNYYENLSHPFARAIFMKFIISEIHPFNDGNGRIARVMMNAELTNKDQTKIIIPTVYREDYIGALRKLTRQELPDAYIRMMERAQVFSATIVGTDMDTMQRHLESSHAFDEPTEGKLTIIEPEAE